MINPGSLMNNYINKFLLWCFLMPSGLYRKFGADVTHLKAILTYKLIIDDRTATGLYKARSGSRGGDSSRATLFTMIISLVMGFMFLFVFAFEENLTRMTMFFSFFGFMLAMFLITDFSHILIDVKDNYIILPKPVTSQTFLLARLLHIVIHVMKILVPMSLPAVIGIWISRGVWGAIVFIPMVALLTMLTFALVNAVYLLIMRVFSPAKINSIITSVQIGFSILLYGSFQLLPRIINTSVIEQVDLSDIGLMWIFPSYWMALGWICFYSFANGANLIIGAVLSVVVPLLSVWVMVRFLAPSFFRKLSMISAGTPDDAKTKPDTREIIHDKTGFLAKVAGLFTHAGIERESFLFTWRMTGRSRDFKMKVYPQVGYLVVLFVMLFIGHSDRMDPDSMTLLTSRMKFVILSVIYLSCVIYMGAVYQLPYYDNFKASWIYFAAPLRIPGLIISGALKACFVKFFMPVVVTLTVVGIFLFGMTIVPNLLFGLGNVFLVGTLYSWVVMDRLPFSVSPKLVAQGQTTFRNIFMLIALPIFALPHYFLFNFPVVLCIIAIVSISTGWMVLRYTKSISWGYVNGEAGA